MRYAICFFPAVGIFCGAALWLWAVIAQATGMSGVLFAAVAASLPILVTGGIHMDGYLDTVDALASHQTREKKLEIMKDPSCGAFAVIYSGVYLLAYAGFACEVYLAGKILLLCPLFVLSRALSGLCAVNLPNARKAGMLCAFTSLARRRTATAALALTGFAAAAGMICLSPAAGGTAAVFGRPLRAGVPQVRHGAVRRRDRRHLRLLLAALRAVRIGRRLGRRAAVIDILFIRHGATEGNLHRRYIGRTDEPLCAAGIAQAERLRGQNLFADCLFVSPLLRARQTAEIVFPQMPYALVEGLRETDFGRFEGKNADELSSDSAYQAWVDAMCLTPIPGGEAVADFKKRCCKAFAETIAAVPDGMCAAFVVHGGVIMAVLEFFAYPKRDFYAYHIGNGECLACTYDGQTLRVKSIAR